MNTPATSAATVPLAATGDWPDSVGAQSLAVTFVADVAACADDGRFTVRSGAQHYDASVAVSCLVPPQPGDRVACWRFAASDTDTVFIVAVLTRATEAAPLRVSLGEGVELSAEHGRLTVSAGQSLQLRAPSCEVHAEQAELRAGKVSLVYRTLQSVGELAALTVGQLRLVGTMLSSVFDQQVHHARQHQRTVDGVDRLDAKVIQQHASSLLHLQGENLLANGERVIKMQGTQIHLG